jgi:glycosyltransferase involved in cell wall biosynthesis
MRVVVWGINYAPEITGIAPHNVSGCEFLRETGREVEMVTTFPYYPEWKKKVGDRGRLYRTDLINGVPVHRCWHFVPQRVTALKRIVHEATFALTSTVRVLGLKVPDVYLVVSPPLILGTVAWFVSLLKNAPFVFHVQDLQPDAAVGLGMLREGWFTRALYRLEAFAYRHAFLVSGISPEILDAFRRKGVPEAKLILYPNSVELPPENTLPKRGIFREKHGFAPDEFSSRSATGGEHLRSAGHDRAGNYRPQVGLERRGADDHSAVQGVAGREKPPACSGASPSRLRRRQRFDQAPSVVGQKFKAPAPRAKAVVEEHRLGHFVAVAVVGLFTGDVADQTVGTTDRADRAPDALAGRTDQPREFGKYLGVDAEKDGGAHGRRL